MFSELFSSEIANRERPTQRETDSLGIIGYICGYAQYQLFFIQSSQIHILKPATHFPLNHHGRFFRGSLHPSHLKVSL